MKSSQNSSCTRVAHALLVFAQPSTSSKVLGTLTKEDDLVATGEEKTGFLKVDGANVSRWVQKTLVMPSSGI